MEHIHDNSVASSYYVPVYKSMMYVTMWLAKSTHQHVVSQQSTEGIIDPTGMETRHFLSRMFVTAKKKEFFTLA